jgi:hypothetical protein
MPSVSSSFHPDDVTKESLALARNETESDGVQCWIWYLEQVVLVQTSEFGAGVSHQEPAGILYSKIDWLAHILPWDEQVRRGIMAISC